MPFCAEIAHAFLRVPAEELGGVGHLAARVRQRLAVLDGDQLREPLGVAHDQLVGLAQDLAALARLLRGPGAERGLRGVERGLGVVDEALATEAILLLGRRIDHVEARAVGGFLPFAADPQVGRDVGEQIVVGGHGVSPPSFRGCAEGANPESRNTHLSLPLDSGFARCAPPRNDSGASCSTSSSPDRRCGRPSAGSRLRECRRPAAGSAAW